MKRTKFDLAGETDRVEYKEAAEQLSPLKSPLKSPSKSPSKSNCGGAKGSRSLIAVTAVVLSSLI